MPNYSIPAQLREHLRMRALSLANKPLTLALRGFPLTTAEVQYHCAALTEDQVNTLRRLVDEGVRTIERHVNLRLAFIRDAMPELRRGVVVDIRLPEYIHVGRGTQWSIPTTKFNMSENHYIVPDLANLQTSSRKDLGAWIDRALRQVRLYEITEYCVTQLLLEKYSPTTSHLHVLWPTLTTLVDINVHPHSLAKHKLWQDRFRNPTRSLRQYHPDIDVKNKFSKLIMAADTMITAGMMLPDPVSPPRGVIHASIEHWERLRGDPTFPLAD